MTRSSALTPLLWLFAMELAGTVITAAMNAPLFVPIVFAAISGLTTIAFLMVYFYLLVKDPEALRTRRGPTP